MSMTCKKSRRKDDKGKKNMHDAHVRAYRKEVRRQKIKECRDYKGYERKRRGESGVKRVRIKQLKGLIRDSLPNATETDVSRITCLVDMAYRDHSYRGHFEYMDDHLGSVNMYGLKKVYSKSYVQQWAADLADQMGFVLGLLMAQAGGDARGTLLGDSSGFSIVKYENWEDAKKGIISRREFNKLHILMAPHGRIVTCAITAGRTHDSPVFREMYKRVPEGGGHTILDAAYLARENCRVIARSGRRPVICPKSNSAARGLHPMGQMLKWHRDDKDGFEKAYHQRSLAETAFSSIKERFGAVARAKTFKMRQLQLALKCICYNLIA